MAYRLVKVLPKISKSYVHVYTYNNMYIDTCLLATEASC